MNPLEDIRNPIESTRTVWQSSKFRQAVYSALVSVFSAFLAGFLASLIPNLGAQQIADIVQWTGTAISGTFAMSIGGSAYVDSAVQTGKSPVAAQAAIATAQAATAEAQAATAGAQAVVAAVVAATPAPPAAPTVQGLPPPHRTYP